MSVAHLWSPDNYWVITDPKRLGKTPLYPPPPPLPNLSLIVPLKRIHSILLQECAYEPPSYMNNTEHGYLAIIYIHKYIRILGSGYTVYAKYIFHTYAFPLQSFLTPLSFLVLFDTYSSFLSCSL